MIPGSIDVILGANVYGQIIEKGIIKGDSNSPVAQLTKFGWIISGPSGSTSSSTSKQNYHVSMDRALHDLLHRFWELEEIPSRIIQCQWKNRNVNATSKQFIVALNKDATLSIICIILF